MLRRALLISSIALLVALGTGTASAIAVPPNPMSTITHLGGRETANEVSVWECLVVAAREMSVFSTSSGGWVIDTLFRSEQALALIRMNGRYGVVYNDGDNEGWISADPRWTDPC